MHNDLKSCHSPTALERYVLSCMPAAGELLSRQCIEPGCTYGHNLSQAAAALAEMLQIEAELRADTSKAGRLHFLRWRMAHAATHANVQPDKHGQPMHESDLDQHILDSLHLAKLIGLPKTLWEFCVSKKTRQTMRAQPSASSSPNGTTRSTDDGKTTIACRENKWFTRERWSTSATASAVAQAHPLPSRRL
eukprot:5548907-Pleurochrysis_carterae.AAC.1